MSPFPLLYEGKEWRTAEALFQALRFDDPTIQEEIRAQKSPIGAKLVAKGRAAEMTVVPLSDQDLANMRLCLNLKLDQHPQLLSQLLETGDAVIIEDVTSRGTGSRHRQWGAALVNGQWIGENKLGKLWMEIRAERAKQ